MADAEITTIVDFGLSGSADDGDPNTKPNPKDYISAKAKPAATQAQDGKTKSESYAATATEIGGNVHAIPGGAGSATAKSFNRVVTGLKVTKQGTFKFEVAMEATGTRRTGLGTVSLQHRANVLDANGNPVLDAAGNRVPNTDLSDTTFNVHGRENKISTSSTVPDGGVTLPKADYLLEIELRLIAEAPVSGDARSTAEVDKATFSIKLV